MCLAAAYTIAAVGAEGGIYPEQLLPTMDNPDVFIRQAVSVGLKAMELGVARLSCTKEELEAKAAEAITRAQRTTQLLMEEGIILPAPY